MPDPELSGKINPGNPPGAGGHQEKQFDKRGPLSLTNATMFTVHRRAPNVFGPDGRTDGPCSATVCGPARRAKAKRGLWAFQGLQGDRGVQEFCVCFWKVCLTNHGGGQLMSSALFELVSLLPAIPSSQITQCG